MANKTLQTRIMCKYDTFTNWTTNNPTLLAGEIAICSVPASSEAVEQEPAILMKVGDGETAFNSLSWVSGLAANVYTWALQPNKPTYEATEISGLDEFIQGEIQDTNTRYQIVADGDMGIKLQSSDTGEAPWTDVGSVITFDPTEDINTALSALSLTTVTAGTGKIIDTIAQSNGVVTATTRDIVAGDIPDLAISQITNLQTTLDSKQDNLEFDGTYNSSTNKVATVSTVTTAKSELIGSDSGITATTIKGAVTEANSYTDTEIASKLGSVFKPVGSITFSQLPESPGASELGNVYNITDAFEADARFVTGEVGESYPAGSNVAVIESEGTYYYDVLAGTIDLSNYATTSSVTEAISDAKTELIGMSSTVTATTIKGAVTESNSYADGLNTAMDSRVDSLETKVGDFSVSAQITSAIQQLDNTDSAVNNQFVTQVTQADGVVSVTRAQPTIANISGLQAELDEKADTADLATIATTGNVNDLEQTSGDLLIFNCGTSSTNI